MTTSARANAGAGACTGAWSTRGERGVAAVWTLLVASGMFVVLLGLVVDGGTVIDARLEAKRVAEQAARAGADQLRGARDGTESIATDTAAAHARNILRQAGWSGTVTVDGTTVGVDVTGDSPTTFLGVIGIHRLPVQEHGAATAITDPR